MINRIALVYHMHDVNHNALTCVTICLQTPMTLGRNHWSGSLAAWPQERQHVKSTAGSLQVPCGHSLVLSCMVGPSCCWNSSRPPTVWVICFERNYSISQHCLCQNFTIVYTNFSLLGGTLVIITALFMLVFYYCIPYFEIHLYIKYCCFLDLVFWYCIHFGSQSHNILVIVLICILVFCHCIQQFVVHHLTCHCYTIILVIC